MSNKWTSSQKLGRPRHWFLDALAITWSSLGLASLGLALLGATSLTSTPLSLLGNVDAYAGLIAVPFVLGFACFGAVVGGYFGSRLIAASACFGPLLLLASFLWLADRFDDLGEGEQVVTLYANGLFIGAFSILPAFLFFGSTSRIMMQTIPHLIMIALGFYFLITFGESPR